jgi:hypothetical protein
MKRLLDVPIICVSAVLIVALFHSPATTPLTAEPAANRPAAGNSQASNPDSRETVDRGKEANTPSTEATRPGVGDRPVQLSDLRDPATMASTPPPGTTSETCNLIINLPPQLLSAPQFSPGFLDLCLQVAGDINAELASQLRVLREKRPKEFELRLRRSPRLMEMALLKQRDPNLYDLKLQEISWAAEVQRATNEVRTAIAEKRKDDLESLKGKLRGVLRAQMGMQLKARKDYLCAIQELAQQLEAEWQRDAENFDTNVEARLQSIIDEAKRDAASGRKGPPE